MATDDSLLRAILLVIAALFVLPFLLMLVIMPMMGVWGGGHMWDGMWNGTGATWLWFFMAVLPLVVILGVGYLLYLTLGPTGARREDPAIQELRAAYARGELSDEEFETRRERLQREE